MRHIILIGILLTGCQPAATTRELDRATDATRKMLDAQDERIDNLERAKLLNEKDIANLSAKVVVLEAGQNGQAKTIGEIQQSLRDDKTARDERNKIHDRQVGWIEWWLSVGGTIAVISGAVLAYLAFRKDKKT